ncbi:hypothetical protein [Marinobacter changyiensis]|uniref:hypothetical protein n=1 Tax=Marinobacter changyiensis TaxID=2604091 RepID=UPI001264C8F6|nr:hypothetical protein [Marinobacter changyiensis]
MSKSQIIESVREDLKALAAAGVPVDTDAVFDTVDRDRESGRTAEALRKTNRYLTELDENGQVIRKKT